MEGKSLHIINDLIEIGNHAGWNIASFVSIFKEEMLTPISEARHEQGSLNCLDLGHILITIFPFGYLCWSLSFKYSSLM